MIIPPSVETIGAVTFADCGENKSHLKVFRVNAGIPIREALEHASHLLYYAKMLSLEAAMDPRAEKFAFASHYLGEMGKAVIDDLRFSFEPGDPDPQQVVAPGASHRAPDLHAVSYQLRAIPPHPFLHPSPASISPPKQQSRLLLIKQIFPKSISEMSDCTFSNHNFRVTER